MAFLSRSGSVGVTIRRSEAPCPSLGLDREHRPAAGQVAECLFVALAELVGDEVGDVLELADVSLSSAALTCGMVSRGRGAARRSAGSIRAAGWVSPGRSRRRPRPIGRPSGPPRPHAPTGPKNPISTPSLTPEHHRLAPRTDPVAMASDSRWWSPRPRHRGTVSRAILNPFTHRLDTAGLKVLAYGPSTASWDPFRLHRERTLPDSVPNGRECPATLCSRRFGLKAECTADYSCYGGTLGTQTGGGCLLPDVGMRIAIETARFVKELGSNVYRGGSKPRVKEIGNRTKLGGKWSRTPEQVMTDGNWGCPYASGYREATPGRTGLVIARRNPREGIVICTI